MSKDTAEKFVQRIAGDKDLQARLKKIRHKGAKDILAEIVSIGKELGFVFTLEEYRAVAGR